MGFVKTLCNACLTAVWLIVAMLALWSREGIGQQIDDSVPPVGASSASASVGARNDERSIVLPWRQLAIPAERDVALRSVLTAIGNDIAARFLQNSQSLDQYVTTKNLAANHQRLLQTFRVGEPKDVIGFKPMLLEPLWCQIADQQVFFLSVTDRSQDTLLAMTHVTVPTKDLLETLKKRPVNTATAPALGALPTPVVPQLTPKDLLNPKLSAAYDRLIAQLQQQGPDAATANAPGTDVLRITLSAGNEFTRMDQGSTQCLNLLLSESLRKTYILVKPVGGEAFATLRDVLPSALPLRRPTRTIVTRWDDQGSRARGPWTLPLSLPLTTSYAETIFGKNIPPIANGQWTISKSGDMLTTQVDQALISFLDTERTALALNDDGPQVVKVYGAWVYVDKGRAYGLKMDDRLVADAAGGTKVQGHVVGYFGPELGLVSPKGYKINEGAIIYVRKGQKEAPLGTTFAFDETKFPTDWPPPASRTAQNK